MKPLSDLALFAYAAGDHTAAFRAPPAPAPQPVYPPLGPGFRGEVGGPSELAARTVAGGSAAMRAIVLREIRDAEVEADANFDGITSDEVAARLGRHALSVQPRVSELFKLGLVQKGKTLGRSALGSPATRWRIRRDETPIAPINGGEQ